MSSTSNTSYEEFKYSQFYLLGDSYTRSMNPTPYFQGQPLVYYAQCQPCDRRTAREQLRKGNKNCFVRAFEWYTQERGPEHTRMPPELGGFAAWLDEKYGEYLRDGEVKGNLRNYAGIQDQSNLEASPFTPSAKLETSQTKKKSRSPWKKLKLAYKDGNCEKCRTSNASCQFILQPKDLAKPTSEYQISTTYPNKSNTTTKKSQSFTSLCRDIDAVNCSNTISVEKEVKTKESSTKQTLLVNQTMQLMATCDKPCVTKQDSEIIIKCKVLDSCCRSCKLVNKQSNPVENISIKSNTTTTTFCECNEETKSLHVSLAQNVSNLCGCNDKAEITKLVKLPAPISLSYCECKEMAVESQNDISLRKIKDTDVSRTTPERKLSDETHIVNQDQHLQKEVNQMSVERQIVGMCCDRKETDDHVEDKIKEPACDQKSFMQYEGKGFNETEQTKLCVKACDVKEEFRTMNAILQVPDKSTNVEASSTHKNNIEKESNYLECQCIGERAQNSRVSQQGSKTKNKSASSCLDKKPQGKPMTVDVSCQCSLENIIKVDKACQNHPHDFLSDQRFQSTTNQEIPKSVCNVEKTECAKPKNPVTPRKVSRRYCIMKSVQTSDHSIQFNKDDHDYALFMRIVCADKLHDCLCDINN